MGKDCCTNVTYWLKDEVIFNSRLADTEARIHVSRPHDLGASSSGFGVIERWCCFTARYWVARPPSDEELEA